MSKVEKKTAYPYITEFKREPFESFVLVDRKKIGSFHLSYYDKIINLYQSKVKTLVKEPSLDLEYLYWFLLLGKYLKEDLTPQKHVFYDFIKSCEVDILEKDQIGFKLNPQSKAVPDIWSLYYALSSLYILGLLEEYLLSKGSNDLVRKVKNFIYEHKKGEIFLHCLDKQCEIHKKPFSSKTFYYVLEILTLIGSDVRLFKEQFRAYLNSRKKIPSMLFKYLSLKYLNLDLEVKDKELQYFHQFQKYDGGFNFSNGEGNIDDTFWIIYTFNHFPWLMDYNPARIYSFINENIQKLFKNGNDQGSLIFFNLSKITILLSFIWKKFIGEIERLIFKQIEKNGFVDIKHIKTAFGLTHGIEEIILYINLSYNFKLKIINNTLEFSKFLRTLNNGLKVIANEISNQLNENSIICLSDILKNYKSSYHFESLKMREDVFPLIYDMMERNFFKGNIRTKSKFLGKSKYYFYLDFLLDNVITSDKKINTEKLFEEKEKLGDIKNDIYNMTLILKNTSTQIKEEIESYLLLDEIDYAKERLRFILKNALLEADFLNENIENSFSQDMIYINIQAVLATEINQWKIAYSIMQKKLNEVEKYLKEKISEKEELKKFNTILDELENRIFEVGEFIKKELDSFRKYFREKLESGFNNENYNLIIGEFNKISNYVDKYDHTIYKISQQITIKEEKVFKKHKEIIDNWVNLKEEFGSIFSYYAEGFKFFEQTSEKIDGIDDEIKKEISYIKQKADEKISQNQFKEAFEIIKKDSESLLSQKIKEIKELRIIVSDQTKTNQKLFLLFQYLKENLDVIEESIINLVAEQVQSLKDDVLEERNRAKIEDFDNFISEQIQRFKIRLKFYKTKLGEAKSIKIKDVIDGFDRIIIELDDKNKIFLKKLNDLKTLIQSFDKNSISIIQWEKFHDYLTTEINNSKDNYVNQIIISEIEIWTKEKKTNKVDIRELANKLNLKCKAVIPLIKEMIEFSKIEGDLNEEKKLMVVHNDAYYKNKELNTYIDTKLLKFHQEKIGKILALYDSGVRNKKLAVNILELQNRITEYSDLEKKIRIQYEDKVNQLKITEEREENLNTKKELENILTNGKMAIQKIKANLNFFNEFQIFISEEYNVLTLDFVNNLIKVFENIENFGSYVKAIEHFESKKTKFDVKVKRIEEKINEKLKGSLTKNSSFKRLETEIREFYVSRKNEFGAFYKAKLDKITEDISILKDDTYRNELLDKINKIKIRLSQLLGTFQTRVEDYIEYKEFKRAHAKVQKREKKIQAEIREVSKNIKNLVREYERKSNNFETKNKYLLDDFELFIKGFRDLMYEKVKSLDEMIIKSYVSMAIKAVADQYLTISFLQNELNIKKQKIQEHLISLISSGKLKGKYDPRIGLYYENPDLLNKVDESELEVMKKMNFRFYMFWRRLRSFASQNYSIFAFLAAILSITLSLFNFTGPAIFILLFVLIIILALYLLIKRKKQDKI
ncbi:MAG: hypothetical protein ACFFDL_03890 [Promethearchaeota archaeon]